MSSPGQKQSVNDGARLVTGGTEMPEGLTTGNYVLPTVFAELTNDRTIAHEEFLDLCCRRIMINSLQKPFQ